MAHALAQKKNIMAVMAAVNKSMPGSIAIASQVAYAHLGRIPTGIFEMDMQLGGGIPLGRIGMVVGEESVGKSTFLLSVIATFQHTCKACKLPFKSHTEEKLDKKSGEVVDAKLVIDESCECGKNEEHVCAYFDSEGHFDPAWAASLGVDVKRLIIAQPENAEQGADVMVKLTRSGELDFLGIDSIAMMTPGREIETGAEGGQRPDLALIMNKFMRSLQSSLNSLGMDNPNKPAILMVNQFREKVGVMYGDPRTWPGGKGQNFASSYIISMRAGKRIDSKGVPGGKEDVKIGVEIFAFTEKNKTFPPYKKASFRLYNSDVPSLGIVKGSVDNFNQIARYGEKVGVFGKSGAWYDLSAEFGDEFKNPNSGNGKFQGMDAVVAFLEGDPKKAFRVQQRILDAVKKANEGAPVSDDDADATDTGAAA